MPLVDAGKKTSLVDTFEQVLSMIINLVAFVVAVIPEADSLTIQSCFVNYNFQTLFAKQKIIYYSTLALECMGQMNCVMIDVSGYKKNRLFLDDND